MKEPAITIDDINKEISSRLNSIPEGEFGEVILEGVALGELPPPDAFLDPPPDVVEDAPEDLDDDWWDDTVRRYPFILGLYIPMRSPGRVVLFSHNLQLFYWSLVHHVLRPEIPYLTKGDLQAAWKLVLMKTHEHELFHHYSDVLRTLFAKSLDSDIEEALAVAWARMRIQEERSKWQSAIGRMNAHAFGLLMRHAFSYRSRGYRDWISYADEVRFKPALLNYLGDARHDRLLRNGVDIGSLIYGMLGQVGTGGYLQTVR